MSAFHAVILTGPGFQDQDVAVSYYCLKGAGYEVRIATDGGHPVRGKYGMPVPLDRHAPSCIPFEELAVDDYDLVVLTGGHEAPDRIRQLQTVKDFVRAMDQAGKVVAGLCHGPWIMISAGIMKGRRACAYAGMRDDLINAGAIVQEGEVEVEVDDNIVTCSYYGYVGKFMNVVVELVEQRAAQPAVV